MTKQSIQEIKTLLEAGEVDAQLIAELKSDSRKGVQQLLERLQRKQEKQKALQDRFIQMSSYETELRSRGIEMIAGIDEAGRGPLAGPVVAAAVILPADFQLLGLNDSKQLTEKQREAFFDIIQERAVAYSITVIHNEEIDQINIFEATKKAMYQAVHDLAVQVDYCLIDAVKLKHLPCPSLPIEKGDAKSVSIAAASVLAKTARDRMMRTLHETYPQYDFASNMGYGTARHLEMLNMHGPSPCHRKSFAPVRNAMNHLMEG